MSKKVLIVLMMLHFFSYQAFAATTVKGQQSSGSTEYTQKVKKIAEFIAGELKRRGVMTLTVRDFTDAKGRPTHEGTAIAQELKKQLKSISSMNFMVVESGAEAEARGTFLQFRGKDQWKLDINVVSTDSGKPMTAYTAVIKKTGK